MVGDDAARGGKSTTNHHDPPHFRRPSPSNADALGVTSFGPTPIPNSPGVVQSSHIAQQASTPRARDKNKPQEADGTRRFVVRDEVRLSDPIAAQAIDGKPDAADEWKNEGGKHRRRDARPDAQSTPPNDTRGGGLDIKA